MLHCCHRILLATAVTVPALLALPGCNEPNQMPEPEISDARAMSPLDAPAPPPPPDVAPAEPDGGSKPPLPADAATPPTVDAGAAQIEAGAPATEEPPRGWRSLDRCTTQSTVFLNCANSMDRNAVPELGFSPDSRYLVTGGPDAAHVWKVGPGGLMQDPPAFAPVGGVARPAVSPDGKVVAILSGDGDLRFFDFATRMRLPGFIGFGFAADVSQGAGLGFTADGTTLGVNNGGEFVLGYDAKMGKTGPVDNTLPLNRRAFAVSPRPPTAAPARGSNPLWIAYDDPRTLMPAVLLQNLTSTLGLGQTHRWAGAPYTVHALAFSPDGNTLAVAFSDNSVMRLNVTNPLNITLLPGSLKPDVPGRQISDLAYSGDGNYLAVVYDSGAGARADRGYVTVVTSGLEVRSFKQLPLPVASVAFSPSGRSLALGHADCWSVTLCHD
jgi:WD40 repeat protein